MTLSIVTINYNNAHGLEQTIKSVIQQTFSDYEYIIIDGGSTDNSINIIKENSDKISYWVSEKDNGVYHAMNKGIAIARGNYLLMLNSGDTLINPLVVSKVFSSSNLVEDILYGNIEWQNQGRFFTSSQYPETLSPTFFWEKSIGHQAAFIKKSAHDIVGLYDEHMKITADWKFFLLAFEKYCLQFRFLPFIITVGDNSGLSWNQANNYIIRKEKAATIKHYFKADYKEYSQLQQSIRPTIKNRIIIIKQRLTQVLKKTF